MNVAAAADNIGTALICLDTEMGEQVFDEWALVEKEGAGWRLIDYSGPRKKGFLAEFNEDMEALRYTLDPGSASVGGFAFSYEGQGTGFDAHICAGPDLFILLNNTSKSTGDITRHPKWTGAQIHFTELLETFIADPITA